MSSQFSMCISVHEQSMNHISLKKDTAGLNVMQVTHCVGHSDGSWPHSYTCTCTFYTLVNKL